MFGRSWLFRKLYRLVEQPQNLEPSHGATFYASRRGSYEYLKRWLDTLEAAVLFAAAFPVLVLISLLIWSDSSGPVLFTQERVGKDGKPFRLYKFRTMVVTAAEELDQNPELKQEYQDTFKIKNDPRVTTIGEFLRRTSLDELPQLFNVIRGEMSLVGPRPLLGPELTVYGAYRRELLSVKPGLTGLWQVLGRSDTGWPEHVRMDLAYVAHRSLGVDISILCATLPAVLSGRGAY